MEQKSDEIYLALYFINMNANKKKKDESWIKAEHYNTISSWSLEKCAKFLCYSNTQQRILPGDKKCKVILLAVVDRILHFTRLNGQSVAKNGTLRNASPPTKSPQNPLNVAKQSKKNAIDAGTILKDNFSDARTNYGNDGPLILPATNFSMTFLQQFFPQYGISFPLSYERNETMAEQIAQYWSKINLMYTSYIEQSTRININAESNINSLSSRWSNSSVVGDEHGNNYPSNEYGNDQYSNNQQLIVANDTDNSNNITTPTENQKNHKSVDFDLIAGAFSSEYLKRDPTTSSFVETNQYNNYNATALKQDGIDALTQDILTSEPGASQGDDGVDNSRQNEINNNIEYSSDTDDSDCDDSDDSKGKGEAVDTIEPLSNRTAAVAAYRKRRKNANNGSGIVPMKVSAEQFADGTPSEMQDIINRIKANPEAFKIVGQKQKKPGLHVP